MSNQQAPGGLGWAKFKSICAEVGGWTWGTVQGAFNEKASLSQIIVDAVIGMIPLVGDVTAVRDLIAVVIGLVDDPEKRESVWEWVLLIVLVCALIPVIGGVIKGVGRIIVSAAKALKRLTGAARAAKLAETAKDIIDFLNRIGWKNAEAWFKSLRLADYQADILKHFTQLMDVLIDSLTSARKRLVAIVPASLLNRIDALRAGFRQLKAKGEKMIPAAVKEFDQTLKEIQAYVHSGGETTSRMAQHEIAAGKKNLSRAEEARIAEGEVALPVRSVKGWKANEAIKGRPESYKKVYEEPKNGSPNLLDNVDKNGHHPDIEAFSGKITSRALKNGEQIFRVVGPETVTHGTKVGAVGAGGNWWGVGPRPRNAKEWRERYAVLDEWNGDSFIISATIKNPEIARHSNAGIKGAFGTVAEQGSKDIPGQYLPGGGIQGKLNLNENIQKGLQNALKESMDTGKAVSWTHPGSGTVFTVAPTGWKDANGIHGYLSLPGSGTAVVVQQLAAEEVASKKNGEVFIK